MKESEIETVNCLLDDKMVILDVIDKVESGAVCLRAGNFIIPRAGIVGGFSSGKNPGEKFSAMLCRASYSIRNQLRDMVVIELQRALNRADEQLKELGLEIGK